MKAIQISERGTADVLTFKDVSIPKCGQDDVLIEMKAIGINYIDIYLRTGAYHVSEYPYIPGKEGAGVIKEVGKNVKDFKVGDRVAFCSGGSGSYAEYATLPASQVVKIPENISFEIAAAAMLQGLTAYYLTHLTYPLQKDRYALIHAGAGGVGLLLIQVAKILGANVITTVSSADKAKLTKQAGADHTVIYTEESFLERLNTITQKEGVHVAYDAVGKTTIDDSLNALRIRGMLVSYGQASGAIPPLDTSKLAQKSLFLTRPVLFHYINTKEALRDMSDKLFDLILNKNLKVTIGQRYELESAAEAHKDLENRLTVGKSILLVH